MGRFLQRRIRRGQPLTRFILVLLLFLWPPGWDVAWAAEKTKVVPLDVAPPEVQKVNWLKYFADFTTWPQSAFTNASAPFVIGILGDDPIIPIAQKFFRSEKAKDREVIVRKYENVADAEKCHILLISASEKDRLSQILNHLKGASVLTVGDTETFTKRGGIINFALETTKKCEINTNSARLANLSINPRFLALVKVVSDEK